MSLAIIGWTSGAALSQCVAAFHLSSQHKAADILRSTLLHTMPTIHSFAAVTWEHTCSFHIVAREAEIPQRKPGHIVESYHKIGLTAI